MQSLNLETIIEKIKPQVVFHLAAHGALPGQKVTIQELVETNLNGLIRLINATKQYDLQLFVNTGSSSEYGVKNVPMKETDMLAPINDYGVSKAAATLYAQKVALTESAPIVTLRLFSPYGYHDDPNRLVPFVIAKALKNESISLSAKQNVRDFIYIKDVVSAYIAVLGKNIKPGEIINVGSGKQHSVYDIVSCIVEIAKSRSKLEWSTMPQQARQIEPKVWQADIQKAKKLLHWTPQFSLEEGIRKTIQHYKKQSYD